MTFVRSICPICGQGLHNTITRTAPKVARPASWLDARVLAHSIDDFIAPRHRVSAQKGMPLHD